MKMMSIVAVTPKEDALDEIAALITESRKDGVAGLDVYSIVHTRDDELVIVNQWASLDAFMDYVNGPHNMIELIEHLCLRYDEENVCRAYSGAILAQHSQAYRPLLNPWQSSAKSDQTNPAVAIFPVQPSQPQKQKTTRPVNICAALHKRQVFSRYQRRAAPKHWW